MGSVDSVVESLWAFSREVTGAALGFRTPFLVVMWGKTAKGLAGGREFRRRQQPSPRGGRTMTQTRALAMKRRERDRSERF